MKEKNPVINFTLLRETSFNLQAKIPKDPDKVDQ